MSDEPTFYEIPSLRQFYFRIAVDFEVKLWCEICHQYTASVATLEDAIWLYNQHICKEISSRRD